MAGALSTRNVDCWMDITRGTFPSSIPIEGAVKVGENLTMTIYIKDGKRMTDLRVKDCYAFDSREDAANGGDPILQITTEQGCPTKPKLIDSWRTTTETGTSGATVLAYTTITAFKFPERENVFLSCNVELCTNGCITFCNEHNNGTSLLPVPLDNSVTTSSPDSVSVTTTVTTTMRESSESGGEINDKLTSAAAALPLEEDDDTSIFAEDSVETVDTGDVDSSLRSLDLIRETTTEQPTTTTEQTRPSTKSATGTSQPTLSPLIALLNSSDIETTTSTIDSDKENSNNSTSLSNITDVDGISQKKTQEVNDRSLEKEFGGVKNKPVKAPPKAVVRPKPKPTTTDDEPVFDSDEDLDLIDLPALSPSRDRLASKDGTKSVKSANPELEQLRLGRRIPAFVPRPRSDNRRDGVPGEERAARATVRIQPKSRRSRSRNTARNSWRQGLPDGRDPGYVDIPVRATRLSHRVVKPDF